LTLNVILAKKTGQQGALKQRWQERKISEKEDK